MQNEVIAYEEAKKYLGSEENKEFESWAGKQHDRIDRGLKAVSTAPALKDAIPSHGFIYDCLDYIQPLTDSPVDFKLIASIMTLSIVLGNQVYIQFGDQKIYPNLWLILIAPSSLYRKSTILSSCRNLVKRVNPEAILPAEITPEAMFKTLEEQPVGTFIWSEFAGAMAGWERSYMAGSKEFLADIFDCPSDYQRRLKNETYEIKNPCVSIFTATALSWFISKIKDGDLRGGFLARFCYVLPSPKNQFIAIPPAPDEQKACCLAKYLNSLKNSCFRMDTSLIQRDYENWLEDHEKELGNNPEHELLSGFYSRLAIYCLKFAMLYHLAEEPEGFTISRYALSYAIALVEGLKKNVKKLVTEDIILDPRERDKQRILRLIRQNGGINHSYCLQLSHMKSREFKETIETLLEQGSIRAEKNFTKGAKKPTIFYQIRT